MNDKIYDSEMKVMNIIWDKSPISAKEISIIANDTIGWNKNTTYTIINKLEAKGYISRKEPGYICTPLVSKSDIQKSETDLLINKLFEGSKKALFSSLLEDEKLSDGELEELKRMIENR